MMECHRQLKFDDCVALGDFCFSNDEKNLFIRLPDRHSGMPQGMFAHDIFSIRIERTAAPNEHPRWVWDGNYERPTLTPSLHLVGVWHGWLRNGQLTEA